jgi:hypothetical protein
MSSKLKISLYFDYILISWPVLFYSFEYLDFQLKLLIELVANLQYFESVMTVVFMVEYLEDLSKSPWAQYFNYFKPIGDVISNQRLVVLFLISKAIPILF